MLDSTTKSVNTNEIEGKHSSLSVNDEPTKNKNGDIEDVPEYCSNKSSKKSVSWKQESALVQITYFEYDESERMNENIKLKAMDMYEHDVERQNSVVPMQKLNVINTMEAKTQWRDLDENLLIDLPDENKKKKIIPGSSSREKMKQALREQSILQVVYFTRNMVPDSPKEPDEMEIFPYFEPLNIPLENISGKVNSTFNYINRSWPESKDQQLPIIQDSIGMTKKINMDDQISQQPQQESKCNNLPVEEAIEINQQQHPQNIERTNHSRSHITSINYRRNRQRRHGYNKSIQNSVLQSGRKIKVRVCNLYAKKGLCTKLNCEFSHTNNVELV